MTRFQRYCAIALASLALVCCAAAKSTAQLNEAQDLYKRSTALTRAGKYAEALPLAQQALASAEKALGPDHPELVFPLIQLATLYGKQNRYADAEAASKRALALSEKAFAPGDPRVAASLSNLAIIYHDEGRFSEAEPLLKRTLGIYEAINGDSHDTAQSLNNLAAVYDAEGRYAEAEALHKRALVIGEKLFGDDNPELVYTLNNLALLYFNRGRYADAEQLYRRALAIDEKALGPDHPLVGRLLANLAPVYEEQGRYAKAEPLLRRALQIAETAAGPDHSSVAFPLNNLALLYRKQGRYADAEPLYERSLAILEKTFGPDNDQVATALNNLANLRSNQGRYADAEPLLKRAVAIHEKMLGPDHASVATAVNNLAMLYFNEEKYADAEPLIKRTLAIYEKAIGSESPAVGLALNNLANLYQRQRRYAEAEPLYQRSITLREKVSGANHRDTLLTVANLASLYTDEQRFGDALPLVRRTIAAAAAPPWSALPVLYGAQTERLMTADEAVDDSLKVVQRARQTAAGMALNLLAVRIAAGSDRLAKLVRDDQDLAVEMISLNKAVLAAVAKEPARRDAAAEQQIKDQIATVGKQLADLRQVISRDFPDYIALLNPKPLTVKDVRTLIADDEAVVIVDIGAKHNYVWAVTASDAVWRELPITAGEIAKAVATARGQLNFDSLKPFDPQPSFDLYRKILGPVEDVLRAKPRWSFVVNGALTSLPPQLLVMQDPAGKALKNVDWIVRRHAVTVLPSLASLKVLRSKSATGAAAKPLIGFANPVFDRDPQSLQQNIQVAASVSAARGIRHAVADISELKMALQPLPDTADELRQVAASVKADPADIILGLDATETRVKQEKLDQYRIVYFATHGLLAGDVADFAKLNAEPALVLTLPETPTETDDGLLTTTEVATLQLNADWVVLSACNTAAAEKPGAEALSGLARAFFYAGGRSVLVSNWEVETTSAVALMTGTFAALAADPKLSHGEALQKSMLAMINDAQHPEWADPKYWAPFVVVGEPAKPVN